MRKDITMTKEWAGSCNRWEETLVETYTATHPLSKQDIDNIISEAHPDGWMFPIVRHNITVADDAMSVRIAVTYDNCD